MMSYKILQIGFSKTLQSPSFEQADQSKFNFFSASALFLSLKIFNLPLLDEDNLSLRRLSVNKKSGQSILSVRHKIFAIFFLCCIVRKCSPKPYCDYIFDRSA